MANRKKTFRLAINTGGGDAPGLNAVIRAATMAALTRGWEVWGIRNGFESLTGGEPMMKLDHAAVYRIAHLGGTILGTTNKNNPLEKKIKLPGMKKPKLGADVIAEQFKKEKLDGIIAIGGDGSMQIANGLIQRGVPIIGVPKTIDNDLVSTHRTFGFDTAVQTATDAMEKLYESAKAHERVFVVEVMGRYSGWIALHAGLGASCQGILIPEIPFSPEKLAKFLKRRKRLGKSYGIICVAEGAMLHGGKMMFQNKKIKGHEMKLGGIAEWVAHDINKRTKLETRTLVLGHLQRGGSPTTYDRLLALRYGAAAVRLAAEKKWGQMVSYQPPTMKSVSIEEVVKETKKIPVTSDTIQTARDLNVCLGD